MKKLILGAFVLLYVVPAFAQTTQVCAATDTEKVAGLFDRCNDSLKTLSPDAVAKNYAEDAVLLPTLSNKPRFTENERKDYFVHFLEGKPVGKIDKRVIKLGCNDAIDTGLYTFTFGDGHTVHARYTFTYVLRNGQWLISSHHSSAMPEKTEDEH